MPLRPDRTKITEPLEWALPPREVARRELRSRLPASDDGRPPLLFVHGAGHGAWCVDRHWLPAAAEQGWPAHAVSLRGHGASAGRERLLRATLRDYTHDVLQAITELPARPVLVGHSMGALVVARVLERYTAAPAAALLAPPGHRHGLGVAARLARRRPRQPARVAVGLPLHLDGRLLLSAEVADEVAAAHGARLTPESPLAALQIALPRRRRAARCPVLVLGGGDDALVPPAAVARTARAHGTRAVLFAGLGHDLMLEARWRQPLGALLSWLGQVEVDRSSRGAQPQPASRGLTA